MMIGRYRQQAGERRKRGADYDDFLEEGELITNVTPVVSPTTDTPFVVAIQAIDSGGKKFTYFGQGGENGQTYSVLFNITTNGTQLKKDTIEFDIEEDDGG
jgi:hypothetical protein